MADLITGVRIVEQMARQLNAICIEEGGLQRDDSRIWNKWIHELTNEKWQDVTATLEAMDKFSKGLLNETERELIRTANRQIQQRMEQNKSFVGQPFISRSGYKTTAWRIVMMVREAYNRNEGIYIPNCPPREYIPKTEVKVIYPTTFDKLFE